MKIDIIGAVGSGKTTLAKSISEKTGIRYFELDKIIWYRRGNIVQRYTDKEIREKFESIINMDEWIIESTPRDLIRDRFEYSDCVIFLDTPVFFRTIRIILRWIKQKIGVYPYVVRPTFCFLVKNLRWSFKFEINKKKFMYDLKKHKNVIIVKNNQTAVENYFFI